jgi:hypothetical protein
MKRAPAAAHELSAAQCTYFDQGGKVTLCHATSSAKNPYVVIRISDKGCIDGHSKHPNDYIDWNNQGCGNTACLPVGAPCDATLGCCSGSCRGNAAGGNSCACSAAGGACATSADCCDGSSCNNGQCAAKYPDDHECTQNSDCASNNCEHMCGGVDCEYDYGFKCEEPGPTPN